MDKECDVLVVGAGPAGSGAAMAAAKHGLKTIFIEEDPVVGQPVQCAEGIGASLLPLLPFSVPKDMLRWSIAGMYFLTQNIAMICDNDDYFAGYTVDRSKWDPWLASLAVEKGASLWVNTKLVKLEFDGDTAVKAIVEQNGNTIEIHPKYIVGADGSHSTVIANLDVPKHESLGYVKSYEMTDLELKYPHHDQMFFGDFAPRAYAYIFPFSNTGANIGIGSIYKDKNLDDLFDRFTALPHVHKQLKNGKTGTEKTGEVPIRDICDTPVYGNVFLVGDAANHNIKPFIEGNIPGILCGNILGDFLFEVSKGNESPENYPTILYEHFSDIKDSEPITDIVYGDHEVEDTLFYLLILGIMSEIIPLEKIETFIAMDYDQVRTYLLQHGGFLEE